jgi:sec-independent protein translocase protein TatC
MKYQPDDDLFKDSTMTFGEHLEELRLCLFRALVGLVIGVVIGLLIGNRIVRFIETPLRSALEDFYIKRADARIEEELARWKAKGVNPGFTRQQAAAAMEAGLIPERVFMDASQLNPKLAFEAVATSTEEEGALKQAMRQLRLVAVFLWRPATEDERVQPIGTGIQEPFMIYMKAGVVAGIVLSSPWVFYQLWMFVAAGLYPHEKRYVHIFLPFSLALFLAGASLAFFFVFQPVLTFLLSFNDWLGIDPYPRIAEWFTFVLILPLGFGISFQLPLVMLFLERIGIFDVQAYIEKWRIAIFVITVLSAVLTPADPYSMLLMAIPLTVLYFGGVLLCRYMPRGHNPYAER